MNSIVPVAVSTGNGSYPIFKGSESVLWIVFCITIIKTFSWVTHGSVFPTVLGLCPPVLFYQDLRKQLCQV